MTAAGLSKSIFSLVRFQPRLSLRNGNPNLELSFLSAFPCPVAIFPTVTDRQPVATSPRTHTEHRAHVPSKAGTRPPPTEARAVHTAARAPVLRTRTHTPHGPHQRRRTRAGRKTPRGPAGHPAPHELAHTRAHARARARARARAGRPRGRARGPHQLTATGTGPRGTDPPRATGRAAGRGLDYAIGERTPSEETRGPAGIYRGRARAGDAGARRAGGARLWGICPDRPRGGSPPRLSDAARDSSATRFMRCRLFFPPRFPRSRAGIGKGCGYFSFYGGLKAILATEGFPDRRWALGPGDMARSIRFAVIGWARLDV